MGVLTEEMQRLVSEEKLAYVATVGPDGRPNLSPRGTLAVWDADHLVYADLASPRSTANLRDRPPVEVNVVDPARRRGFRFRGAARVVDHGPEFDRAVDYYAAHGVVRPRDRIRSVVLIRVLEARPVRSPGYDLGVSEAETQAWWAQYYAALWTGAPPPKGGEP